MSIFASCVLDFWEETEEALEGVGTERVGETRRPKRSLRSREVMFESVMTGDGELSAGVRFGS